MESFVSRAFVKETDESFEILPDRSVSPHPNLVTPQGLALIEVSLARLREQRAQAQKANDRAVRARIDRDLRYWSSRQSTAQVVHSATDLAGVHFGCTVTIARDGRCESYRIVGEDEADPNQGTLSYVSPLAQALMGKQVGDAVRAGRTEAEILEITPVR